MKAPNGNLGWDLHSHLVPGVDDGARTMEEALECIRFLEKVGYNGAILTPHIYRDVHPNSAHGLTKAFDGLTQALAERSIRFQVRLAAEYFADEHFVRLIESEPLLCFGPEEMRFVLIEFPYIGEPIGWTDPLSALMRAGYTPVIAHPERYRYFVANTDQWLESFGAYAVHYQCEIGSLAGQYGAEPNKVARKLLKNRIPTFWGTDLHRPQHVDRFIVPGLRTLRPHGAVNPLLEP